MLNQNPLHISCRLGHLEAAKIFLQSGVNALAKDAKGKTPHDYASKKMYKDILDILAQSSQHKEMSEEKNEEKQGHIKEQDK